MSAPAEPGGHPHVLASLGLAWWHGSCRYVVFTCRANVTAIGLAVLGFVGLVGGVLAGATVGSALEDALSHGLPKDEEVYRRGFEAALHADIAGKPYRDVVGYLQVHSTGVYDHEAFRRGYARGRAYDETCAENGQT